MRQKQRVFSLFLLSPSSRRAWIEILCRADYCGNTGVALLTEGVDRNYFAEDWYREMPMSPSSRRAWIEIEANARDSLSGYRRPPHGGRG